tara:strand:- start:13 stop:288 length:276 start_codon:yes stop_codon:yes gene_type:complete
VEQIAGWLGYQLGTRKQDTKTYASHTQKQGIGNRAEQPEKMSVVFSASEKHSKPPKTPRGLRVGPQNLFIGRYFGRHGSIKISRLMKLAKV